MNDKLNFFDTQPKAVDGWLEMLPIAHIGETARQLYMAMRFTNNQETIPVKHYFHFLEGVSQPLSLILPELYKHYAGKPLPLSPKRRKVADLYTQLLRQAIIGYQHVIAHSIELNRFGWKRVVTTSVHRIFHFSSLLLCNYRQLYLPYPKGMWQQLYWTYQLIENYGLLNTKIQGLGEAAGKTTIATEFKKLLLLSPLAPNLFKQDEFEAVVNNMDLWLQNISLAADHQQDSMHTYAFTLETDIAPALVANKINTAHNQMIDVRFLDLSNLLSFMNKAVTRSKPNDSTVKLARNRFISKRTLLILLNAWGRPASRDGERRIIQGTAEVAIGISAIHYVISSGRSQTPADAAASQPKQEPDSLTISPATLPNDSDNPLSLLGFATERDTQTDVWDSAYFEPEAPPPSWTESMRMKVYSYLNAKVLNISKGGFCIALPQDGVEHIQTNELVAIRGKTGGWQLGEIRWMICPTGNAIRAGIKRLSQKILPAQVTIKTDSKYGQPIKCLIGEYENEQVVYLPNIPASHAGKPMSIEVQGNHYRLSILDQLMQTPLGTAYYIELHERANKSSAKSADGYDTIWASL